MNLNFLITRTNKFLAMAVKKQKTILVPSIENELSSASTASTSIALPLNTASAADAPSSASTASASAADSPSSASTATASTTVVAAQQIHTVPVADPDFTYDMAVAAGSRCSKCRIADCFTQIRLLAIDIHLPGVCPPPGLITGVWRGLGQTVSSPPKK